MIRTTLALLVTLGTQSAIAATVIHAGFLFDTKEGELLEKQTITIEGGRVVSVNDGFLRPEGSTVIDLSVLLMSLQALWTCTFTSMVSLIRPRVTLRSSS